MKLVELKCKNCNGDLVVNYHTWQIICPYCQTKYALVGDKEEKKEIKEFFNNDPEGPISI